MTFRAGVTAWTTASEDEVEPMKRPIETAKITVRQLRAKNMKKAPASYLKAEIQ